jgi:phosphoserine phosphatase
MPADKPAAVSQVIAVVSGKPGAGAITDDVLSIVARVTGAGASGVHWLAAGDAVEARCHASNASDLRASLASHPVDVNTVPSSERKKRLLIADMDSTMIQQECIDEMADLFGLKPQIAAITERAMRGELPFEQALTERLGLLKGLDEAALARVYAERITEMPGAHTLVATMKRHGAYTALVSGGFTFFTSRVAAAIGFDVNRANILAFEEGRLAGGVTGPILGKEAKLAALKEFAGMRGLPISATLAVGDGANDLDMIRAAGLGVAYRAKPVVAAEAAASITHGDLTALLYLQGYTRDQFVHG